MDLAGEHTLARAARAQNEDRRRGLRRLEGNFERLLHRWFSRNELARWRFGRELRFQLVHPALQPARPGQLIQHLPDLVGRKRFRNEVERPPPHGLDRRRNGGVGCEHDHGDRRVGLLQTSQNLQPIFAPQLQVEETHLAAFVLQGLQSPHGAGRFKGFMSHALHRQRGGAANTGFIIDDQDAHGRWWGGRKPNSVPSTDFRGQGSPLQRCSARSPGTTPAGPKKAKAGPP
jgi:hypothetical protein